MPIASALFRSSIRIPGSPRHGTLGSVGHWSRVLVRFPPIWVNTRRGLFGMSRQDE